MTSTLRANRRTIVNRLGMRPSVATSVVLLWCAGLVCAQEPIRPPLTPLSETKQQPGNPLPPATQDVKNQLALEEEGRFTPPERADLYRVDSEASLAERARLLRKITGKTELEFPNEDLIRITTTLETRHFQEMKATAKASYVVYQPLYFQQNNYERYGWDLGVFQPLVSTAHFYTDVLMLPYNMAIDPPWHCDASVGYALPGDPEPFRLLTPRFSWRGVAAEVSAAVGGMAIFP